ncbi:MAG: sarcosine oxidase subunit alpha family protein [Pseudomonadota bacterium]
MTGAFRTLEGGRIDRSKPLAFTFDGKSFTGCQGDTLASALIANGVHLTGRSFKYHRPRGIMTAGAEEPNAIVTVSRDTARTTPNLRATQIELYDGLKSESQNRWPSLERDAGSVNDLLSPVFVSGFYYKTFMWPASFWKSVYEPNIRAAAGFGKAPTEPDPDWYQNRYAHCDVLVIGAGPAGLAAALSAAEAGARVIVCDEQAEFGGSLLHEATATIDGKTPIEWMTSMVMTLALKDNVTLLPRTQAFGYFADNFVALCERVTDHLSAPHPDLPRERMWQVRARQVVVAAGAIERPLVFPENDRPGVMLADAGRVYANRYGARPGERAVVATACDSAYRAAFDLQDAGMEIAVIADLRAEPGAIADEADARGIEVQRHTGIVGTKGRLRVHTVELGRIGANGEVWSGDVVSCDTVLMSAGWTPSVHMVSQSRGKLRFDADRQIYVPGQPSERQVSAGACNGTFDLVSVIDEGYAAGANAATAAGVKAAPAKNATVETDTPLDGQFAGAVPHNRGAAVRAFVDFQHDVTSKDVKLAIREGFKSIEHVKRYTTTGMATDQGKTSNMNALAIASSILDRPVPEIGLTTFRMPYTPVTFGALAGTARGDLLDPVRRTPMHVWEEQHGAVFEDVGQWKRAWYYPKAGEDMHAAVNRECLTVRNSVGLFDASTLGKIEVVGPDAAEFMNRMYINAWTKLAPGRCRYGIMCRDDGFVYDDGVIARLAEDRFHVTTTTGGAPRVLAFMEDYLQTEWTDLDVWLTSTTEQWAVIAVQGPKAREVIAPFVDDIDLSGDALPHMAVREGHICGVPTRLFRVSFTGELGYEINVPADYGLPVWNAVWAEAEKHDACVYGTETMHVLRAEKGYIIVGQDTDGTLTPDEAGVGWAIGKKKPDFVGKRGLYRPDLVLPDRKQIVGLAINDNQTLLEEGAQITEEAQPATGTHALGHVTSAYWSATLDRPIALAMVERGRDRVGETLYVPMPSGAIEVTVTDPVFFDKEGARING